MTSKFAHLGQTVQQVSDIVQEGSDNQFVGGAGGLGQVRGLQGVLRLGHLLAEVGALAPVGEHLQNAIDDFHWLSSRQGIQGTTTTRVPG